MYQVRLKRSAAKELESLPGKVLPGIVRKIDALAENPYPSGCKKLKNRKPGLWRIRSGSYRIVYAVDSEIEVVDIRKIGHRKDVYEF